jgi:quercetin dioxygenase-like cupin family protein
MSTNITHYSTHVGIREDKFYKTTLFQGEHLMLGLNCLEPGQVQSVHDHETQDKFYFVLEGQGTFTVGDEVSEVGPGHVVWAVAGVPHGVANQGSERLVIFMGIAPSP